MKKQFMKPCGIGFCGAGKWVKNHHIPELSKKNDRYEIVGFYDIFRESAEACANRKFKVYDTLDELSRDPDVDVIIVATKPVETHFENTMRLLDAGKNVILEKPMAYRSDECDAMIAKSREKGVIFSVHHNLRYSICLKATLEVIRQGAIGDPVLVEITSPRSWYEHDDFSNYAVHMVDQALTLNRSPLKEVSATFVHPGDPMETCGYGDAWLRFEEPPVIRISIKPQPRRQIVPDDRVQRDYFRFYTAGTLDAFGIDDLGHIPNPEELTCNRHYYFDNIPRPFTRPEFLENLGKDYFDSFYESWANGTPLPVTAEEARNAIRCIELMHESARSNRTVSATGMLL